MTQPIRFDTYFGTVEVHEDRYADGALAIRLRAIDGEPIATLSTNLPPYSRELPSDCFLAKDWTENEKIAKDALASGHFRVREDLPAVQSRFVTAEVWEIVRNRAGGGCMSAKDASGPAFPHEHRFGDGTVTRHTGMTLRQYAAIKLRVPDSGTDWLDAMIAQALRRDVAQALLVENGPTAQRWLNASGIPKAEHERTSPNMVLNAADAFLEASRRHDGP